MKYISFRESQLEVDGREREADHGTGCEIYEMAMNFSLRQDAARPRHGGQTQHRQRREHRWQPENVQQADHGNTQPTRRTAECGADC